MCPRKGRRRSLWAGPRSLPPRPQTSSYSAIPTVNEEVYLNPQLKATNLVSMGSAVRSIHAGDGATPPRDHPASDCHDFPRLDELGSHVRVCMEANSAAFCPVGASDHDSPQMVELVPSTGS